MLLMLLMLLRGCRLGCRRDWGEVERVAGIAAARRGDPDLGLLLLLRLGQLFLDGRPPGVLVGLG